MELKKCDCGAYTDADEKHCPQNGTEDSRHRLTIVEVNESELEIIYMERRIWTKHPGQLEKLIAKSPP